MKKDLTPPRPLTHWQMPHLHRCMGVPNLIPITDPNDLRIVGYAQIRERDLVGRDGLFVAEGEVVVRALARASLTRPVSLLLAEKRVAGLSSMIQALDPEIPVYVAGQAVMDAVVGFPIHRGVLALGRRREILSATRLLADVPSRAIVLVLCGITNHDNMGGLFRNAAAFGVNAVLVDADCCDPLYRKAIRVSVGAVLNVPFARLRRDEDVMAHLTLGRIEPLALSPAGGVELSRLRPQMRSAVLLGAEGPGLPQALLDQATTLRIPMAAGFDSLNVATTAGIVLHHLKYGAAEAV